ncbi:hypothetical protein [Arenibacter algicola]|uniref:Uncharacterized protein n=1 Tax=Arenibacter algicola TaxID=616991 RepID=A0A221UVL2_9FLAO|nr:hypothetical protein [Arenibacter algicola]ASO05429.1 hypothetical protein AREALGSMS7_01968 [Arenibacter algicola]|tara:strand:+ start:70 stop:513 length:444 start_codon:yes stop_codon:yes gene_type:complete
MEFEPEYFSGILKITILTLLISIVPIYFTENWILIFAVSIIGFLTILVLNNKKWIKKIKLDFENKRIEMKYPFNIIGPKKSEILFTEIDELVYYEYMYRTPAHFKIGYGGKKIRFQCTGTDSKKVSSAFGKLGIKTNFYHKKEVGFR